MTSVSLRLSSVRAIALILAYSLPNARVTPVLGSKLATIVQSEDASEIRHSQSTEWVSAFCDCDCPWKPRPSLWYPRPVTSAKKARDRLGYRLQTCVAFPCSVFNRDAVLVNWSDLIRYRFGAYKLYLTSDTNLWVEFAGQFRILYVESFTLLYGEGCHPALCYKVFCF